MNNIQKIILFQSLPSYCKQFIQNTKKLFSHEDSTSQLIIENINYFKNEKPKTKHALISFPPTAWITAIQEYPKIKSFNITGLIFEVVKALNENGYLVNIVDLNKEYTPTKNYELYIGHGGRCRTIIDNLNPSTKILQYISGIYWKQFEIESNARYENLYKRKNISIKTKYARAAALFGDNEGEEYLTKKANVLFTANCPNMIEAYGEYKNKFYFTGFAAYLDKLLYVRKPEKDFEKGRNNFIYVAGTGGNIQKGMDVLIETFMRTPELNLYIYCKVEEEIVKYYRGELKEKNIHYIYHWRFKPFQKRLRELIKNVNFTIHACHNFGVGTAFMGSMGVGLIPVGSVDLLAPPESCVLIDSWQIDALVDCVKEASNKSAEWCRNASEVTMRNYKDNWSVENFSYKFNELIKRVTYE